MALEVRKANEGRVSGAAREKQKSEAGLDSQRLIADAVQGPVPLEVQRVRNDQRTHQRNRQVEGRQEKTQTRT